MQGCVRYEVCQLLIHDDSCVVWLRRDAADGVVECSLARLREQRSLDDATLPEYSRLSDNESLWWWWIARGNGRERRPAGVSTQDLNAEGGRSAFEGPQKRRA